MKGLLITELIKLKKNIKILLLAFIAWPFEYYGIEIGSIANSFIIAFGTLALLDSYSKSYYEMDRILPVSSNTLVISKYVFSILGILLSLLLSFLYSSLSRIIFLNFIQISLLQYYLSLLLQLFIVSVAVYFMFYVGPKKSVRFMNLLSFFSWNFNFRLLSSSIEVGSRLVIITICVLMIVSILFISSLTASKKN